MNKRQKKKFKKKLYHRRFIEYRRERLCNITRDKLKDLDISSPLIIIEYDKKCKYVTSCKILNNCIPTSIQDSELTEVSFQYTPSYNPKINDMAESLKSKFVESF